MRFDFHHWLSTKYAQWVSMALIFIFALLIIIEWATLRISPVKVQSRPEINKEIAMPSEQESFEPILKASLFGIYVSNDLNETSVKKSMLNVTLVGILFADKMSESQVIIRSANGEEKTYKIGDTIPGDAVIKRVTANGILVERNGSLESLSLPKNELNFEPAPQPLKEE